MPKKEIAKLISKYCKLNTKQIESIIEIPPDPNLGDYSFPCFNLCKEKNKNPIEICEELKNKIKLSKLTDKIESKGPYLNFFINKKFFTEKIIKESLKKDFGKKRLNLKIMIEFSQPNTHKAFHVGHIRGTSLGESLSRIAEWFGEKTIRANYMGDTGMHIAKWIWNYNKYHKKQELKSNEQWIAKIYVEAVRRLAIHKKFEDEVLEINKKLDEKSDKNLNELWKKTRKLSLDEFEKIYKELDTKFDKYYFESQVEQPAKKIAQDLLKKHIAKKSEGAVIMDLEKYDLGIWVLLRKDGTVLYSAKDIELAQKKFKDYKLDHSVYVIADAQNLHMKQLFKTLELMNFKHLKKLHHVSYGLVRLPTGKMSSRTGENILYSNFKKEMVKLAKKGIKNKWPKISDKELEKRALKISIGAMKYPMLKQDPKKVIIFDQKEAMKFEGDTGPYLQYSYARASSILRKSKKKPNLKINKVSDKEFILTKKISEFPGVIEDAYEKFAPNLIANYAYQLSQTFNEFYHESKVIGSKDEEFRLILVDSFRKVLKDSLFLLGIGILEEM